MSENALERLARLVERIIHPPAGDGSWACGRLRVGRVEVAKAALPFCHRSKQQQQFGN
jgi:hypothetical protein